MAGVGKSAVGRRLARRIGWSLADIDELVEAAAGSTVAELFAEQGEEAFRAIESLVLAGELDDPTPSVVATGGGIVVEPANREHLARAALSVWLRADVTVLADRVERSRTVRPLLMGDTEARLRELSEARAPLYAEVADVVLDVDDVGLDEVVEAVVAAVGARLGIGAGS